MGWKILVTDGIEDEGIQVINQKDQFIDRKGISPEDLLTEVGDVDALIVRGRTKVTQAVFEAAKKLKVVGRMGVGVDNIDLTAAKAHHVTVVNAAQATTIAVAELTMAFMLAMVRDLPIADQGMKTSKWLKKELNGSELCHKTLGIIGYGNIGEAVSKRAQAFDMKVIGFDPVRKPGDILASGAEPVELDTLLARADIITLHIPLLPATKHILDAAAFEKMKPGVMIICAARGGVIDEPALMDALNSGKVSHAALDVFEVEPPTDYALAADPHVIATPHIGAQTAEAQVRAAVDIATEVINALDGKSLRWKIC